MHSEIATDLEVISKKKYGKHMPPHTSRKILRSLLAELK